MTRSEHVTTVKRINIYNSSLLSSCPHASVSPSRNYTSCKTSIRKTTMAIALVALVMTLALAPPIGAYDSTTLLNSVKWMVEQLEKKHVAIENKIDVLNANVYFKATFQQSEPTVRPGGVVFNKELNNTGGGYNRTTGIFTATLPGVYVFTVQSFQRGRADTNWDFYLNEDMALRSKYLTSDDTSNDYLYLVTLRAGDKVSVRNRADVNIYGENHSFFSGWIIRAV